jgi:PmbA protein
MSQDLDFLTQLISAAKAHGADHVDALLAEGADISASTRLGQLEDIERSESKAFGLRVIVDQKQAIVSSTDFSQDAVKLLTERAVSMAGRATQDPFIGLATAGEFAQDGMDLQLYDEYEPSTEQLIELALRAEDAAMSVTGITNSEGASASSGSSKISLMTSSGFAKSARSSSSSVSVSVIAGKDDHSVARYMADLKSAEVIGRSAAKNALAKIYPKKITTASMPVVFCPRMAKGLISSFASACNGALITRGTSFLKNHLQQLIFNKDINIFDDPFIIKGLGSRNFDGEGIAGGKLALVKDGVLNSWLLDIRTGNKLGLPNTGNAARGFSSPPSPSTSNLYLQNGTLSPEELIRDIKCGLYVTDMFGTGCNIITGDYSQGVSGFYIENGQLTYPVNEITIASNIIAMFKNLKAANDLEFLYSTNSPTIRIESMVVAGA